MTTEMDRLVSDMELSVDAIVWLCPVCGIKRNIGNHAKCSKITQLKHQQNSKNAAT